MRSAAQQYGMIDLLFIVLFQAAQGDPVEAALPPEPVAEESAGPTTRADPETVPVRAERRVVCENGNDTGSRLRRRQCVEVEDAEARTDADRRQWRQRRYDPGVAEGGPGSGGARD